MSYRVAKSIASSPGALTCQREPGRKLLQHVVAAEGKITLGIPDRKGTPAEGVKHVAIAFAVLVSQGVGDVETSCHHIVLQLGGIGEHGRVECHIGGVDLFLAPVNLTRVPLVSGRIVGLPIDLIGYLGIGLMEPEDRLGRD